MAPQEAMKGELVSLEAVIGFPYDEWSSPALAQIGQEILELIKEGELPSEQLEVQKRQLQCLVLIDLLTSRIEELEIRLLLERGLQDGHPIHVTFSSEPFLEKKVSFAEVWEKYDEIYFLFLGILISLASEVAVQILHLRVMWVFGLPIVAIMAFIVLWAWWVYHKARQ